MTSPSPVTTARASLDRRHAEAGHAVQRSGHARADQIAAGVSRPSPARSWPQINPSLPLEQQLENRCFLEFRGRHYTVFSKSQPSARSRKTRAPRRAQQVRVHGFAERGLETSGAATASTRTARRAPELARVPTPASSQQSSSATSSPPTPSGCAACTSSSSSSSSGGAYTSRGAALPKQRPAAPSPTSSRTECDSNKHQKPSTSPNATAR
jgi:hypothetical protein